MRKFVEGQVELGPADMGKWLEELATTYNVCHVNVGIRDGRILTLETDVCIHGQEETGIEEEIN